MGKQTTSMKLLLLAAVVALGCQANAAHEAEQSVASLNAEEGVNRLIKGEHAHAEQDIDSDDVKDDVEESVLLKHGEPTVYWKLFANRYRKIFVGKECMDAEEDLVQGADHNAEEQLTDENAEEEQQSTSRRILGRRNPPPPPRVHGRNYLSSMVFTTGSANPVQVETFADCPRCDQPAIQESIQCRVQRKQYGVNGGLPPKQIGANALSTGSGGVLLRKDKGKDGVDPSNSWRMWRTKGECKLVDKVTYCPFHLASVKDKRRFLTANSKGEGQVLLGKSDAGLQCLNSWYISTKMWYSATYDARHAYCVKHKSKSDCEEEAICAPGTEEKCNTGNQTGTKEKCKCKNCLAVGRQTDDGYQERCSCWCCERLQAFEAGSTGI